MGQYYKPINLETNENLNAHQFDNGLKLMEHSWMNNDFVQVVETLLMPNHDWHLKPLVWAGDYADAELDSNGNERKTKEGHDITLYGLSDNNNTIKPKIKEEPKEFKYIVNHTKKQYVNKDLVPKDSDGWQIHPLPLLTCEGNGRGGGDYHGKSKLVGYWARDIISIEKQCPKSYKELNFDLVE